MEHFLDHDACCIHCGIDACDVPRGEKMPPCEVWHPETRAANVQHWEQTREQEWEDLE